MEKILGVTLIYVIIMYFYLLYKTKWEYKFSKKAISIKEVSEKMDLGFTGYVICVDEYHITNNTSSLKQIYNQLTKNDNVILYRISFEGKEEEKYAEVIHRLKINHTPCILYLLSGKAMKEQLHINRMEGKKAVEAICKNLKLINKEVS